MRSLYRRAYARYEYSAVFAAGNTAAGAVQIFPSESSRGLGVIVEGDQVKADIEVYPLNDIWSVSRG